MPTLARAPKEHQGVLLQASAPASLQPKSQLSLWCRGSLREKALAKIALTLELLVARAVGTVFGVLAHVAMPAKEHRSLCSPDS